MITVVTFLQFLVCFLLCLLVIFRQQRHFIVKDVVQLFFSDTADVAILFLHRDVLDIVKVAEDAEFAELGDTCEKHEPQISVGALQCAVERLEHVAELYLEIFVAYGLKHRLIVFVDENNHVTSGLLFGGFDKLLESSLNTFIDSYTVIYLFILAELSIKNLVQVFSLIKFLGIEIKMQHGIFNPVFLQLLYRQAFKEMSLSFEIRFYRRHQQTLAETSWSAEEEICSPRGKPMDMSCLIYIDPVLFP